MRILRVLIDYLLPCDDTTVWMRVPRLGVLGGPGRGALLLEGGAPGGRCEGVKGGETAPGKSISAELERGAGDEGGDDGGVGCSGVERADRVTLTVCPVVSEAGRRGRAGERRRERGLSVLSDPESSMSLSESERWRDFRRDR